MLFGPILSAELVRVARQRRWYLFRFLMGLFLLVVIFMGYRSASSGRNLDGRELNSFEVAIFAQRVLIFLAIGQAIAIFFQAPAMVAGAIAEEKQRKTLHYLLSSRLSSFEIVVGKLAARLILIFIPILLGVPILAMLCTLGGIEPVYLLMIYGVTLSTALFEASIAILVSTLVRRGREALLVTFLIGIAWFVGPVILKSLMSDPENRWAATYERWIAPVNDHLIALGPLSLVNASAMPMATWQASMIARGWSMVGHQAVGVGLLLALAVWQLRPAFRRQAGGGITASRALRKVVPRIRPRPACGDSAMLWKETHGTAGARLSLLVSFVSAVTIVLIAFDSLKEILPAVWNELLQDGYRGDHAARTMLNTTLRLIATGLFLVWSILLAMHAATSISREREEDTWVSLVSTPLDARSILDAKLIGSLWMCRHLVYAIVAVWLFGLATGAFHPIGLVLSALQFVTFGVLFAAGGTLISLSSGTTMRSLGLSLGMLLLLAVGVPLAISIGAGDGPSAGVTSPPYLFAYGLLDYRDVFEVLYWTRVNNDPNYRNMQGQIARAVTIGTLAYMAIAPILVVVAYRRFDRLLDRPRRTATPAAITAPARAGAGPVGLPAGRA